MDKWEVRWRDKLKSLTRTELTNVINDCYSRANSVSRIHLWSLHERDIWKQKAKIAIELRSKR